MKDFPWRLHSWSRNGVDDCSTVLVRGHGRRYILEMVVEWFVLIVFSWADVKFESDKVKKKQSCQLSICLSWSGSQFVRDTGRNENGVGRLWLFCTYIRSCPYSSGTMYTGLGQDIQDTKEKIFGL